MACGHSPHGAHCDHVNRLMEKGEAEYVCCWCGRTFRAPARKSYPRHGKYLPPKKEKKNAS